MKYVPEFDGLRAMAVLLVMAGHAQLIGFADGGLVGVTGFFVLSGYLITGVLIDDGAVSVGQLGRRFTLAELLGCCRPSRSSS